MSRSDCSAEISVLRELRQLGTANSRLLRECHCGMSPAAHAMPRPSQRGGGIYPRKQISQQSRNVPQSKYHVVPHAQRKAPADRREASAEARPGTQNKPRSGEVGARRCWQGASWDRQRFLQPLGFPETQGCKPTL